MKADTVRLVCRLSVAGFVFLCLMFVMASLSVAQEPGWTNRVIKVGQDRASSQATPIVLRPYRPLHFYGNTVRRLYYRGAALPSPADLGRTTRSLLRTR